MKLLIVISFLVGVVFLVLVVVVFKFECKMNYDGYKVYSIVIYYNLVVIKVKFIKFVVIFFNFDNDEYFDIVIFVEEVVVFEVFGFEIQFMYEDFGVDIVEEGIFVFYISMFCFFICFFFERFLGFNK